MNSRGALFFFSSFLPYNDEQTPLSFCHASVGRLLKSDYLFSCYRTFEFTEKKDVDRYYPQYYHKIDKVKKRFTLSGKQRLTAIFYIFLGWSPGLH